MRRKLHQFVTIDSKEYQIIALYSADIFDERSYLLVDASGATKIAYDRDFDGDVAPLRALDYDFDADFADDSD